MGWLRDLTSTMPKGPPPLPPGPHRWAVVDVETSGLHVGSHRVLSVAALALDPQGRPEERVVSLVDAGCDPGPVHIHGLMRQRRQGAPRFEQVLPGLLELLDGRVLVAHNASFDHGFLAAEAARAGTSLPTRQRLCTLASSRRLGVDVPDHRLGTLAAHWTVPHDKAHDALADATALVGVFAHSLDLAARLQMPLPVVGCADRPDRTPFPPRVVKTACRWRNPGRWQPGAPLVQGMKVVVTGDTGLPRGELVSRLAAAGLDVTASVSRVTALVVCNEPGAVTAKAVRARQEGTPVVDEATALRLLAAVRPGLPRTGSIPAARATTAVPVQRQAPTVPAGPLAGRRVLVLGGTHDQAASVRAALVARGAAAAVNLSANVTDLVLLDGGDRDPRLARALDAGVRAHGGPFALGVALPGAPAPAPQPPDKPADDAVDPAGPALSGGAPAPAMLTRGAVLDLPDGTVWTFNVAWRADAVSTGAELDVVAFLFDANEKVVADEDFVFYNAPVSDDGAVALSVDGDSEQAVRVDLDLLPEHCTRVTIAAALSGETTFGDLGAVTVAVDGDDGTVAAATLDAGTSERTMILTELYRRGDRWRVRAVGQGYDHALDGLATRYGVTVD